MIEITNLSVNFGRVKALEDLNLALSPGEAILLAGANGAGKTTILRALTGVLRTPGARISVAGIPVGPDSRRRTAYISASLSGYDSLRLGDCLRLHASAHPGFKMPSFNGIRMDTRRRLSTLSRGERALFFLGMGLGIQPECVLIDDVLHYLDPHLREVFLDALLQAVEESRTTVIIASQSPVEVEGLVERVVLLQSGRIILDRPVDQLKQRFLRVYSDTPPPENLPVVYHRRWSGSHEWYLYPWDGPPPPNTRAEHLGLPDILKALIGGHYAAH